MVQAVGHSISSLVCLSLTGQRDSFTMSVDLLTVYYVILVSGPSMLKQQQLVSLCDMMLNQI